MNTEEKVREALNALQARRSEMQAELRRIDEALTALSRLVAPPEQGKKAPPHPKGDGLGPPPKHTPRTWRVKHPVDDDEVNDLAKQIRARFGRKPMDTSTFEKECCRCHVTKPLRMFDTSSAAPDRRRNICMECEASRRAPRFPGAEAGFDVSEQTETN